MRILGITTEPPEIVTVFDPDDPTDVELEDVSVCALLADPNQSRSLYYEMVACAPRHDARCSDLSRPYVDVGFGTVLDPEEASAPVQACGTLPAGAALLGVIEDAVALDSLAGFGGIAVQIELYVRGVEQTIAQAQYATKRMLYSPKIPIERVANRNPSVDGFVFTREDSDEELEVPLGRCRDVSAIEVAPGDKLELLPIETPGVREEYLVPTFDGGSRMFRENLTYAWYATAGSWSPERSGGPRDFVGNEPTLDATWTAPTSADVIGAGLLVELWFVQRDERGGQAWYQSCVSVIP